jgi:hypothetical protein
LWETHRSTGRHRFKSPIGCGLFFGIEELDLEPSIDDRLRPADGAVKEKTILDTPVREPRYQLAR